MNTQGFQDVKDRLSGELLNNTTPVNKSPDKEDLLEEQLEVFVRSLEQGHEVTFLHNGQVDWSNGIYFVSNKTDEVKHVHFKLKVNHDTGKAELDRLKRIEHPADLTHVTELTKHNTLTAYNKNTIDLVKTTPTVASFLIQVCPVDFNLQDLKVSETTKLISGSDTGHKVPKGSYEYLWKFLED